MTFLLGYRFFRFVPTSRIIRLNAVAASSVELVQGCAHIVLKMIFLSIQERLAMEDPLRNALTF
jgi:hypothetical protein